MHFFFKFISEIIAVHSKTRTIPSLVFASDISEFSGNGLVSSYRSSDLHPLLLHSNILQNFFQVTYLSFKFYKLLSMLKFVAMLSGAVVF